jgi:hypothetical protein
VLKETVGEGDLLRLLAWGENFDSQFFVVGIIGIVRREVVVDRFFVSRELMRPQDFPRRTVANHNPENDSSRCINCHGIPFARFFYCVSQNNVTPRCY